jgi:hypothetical protein
VKPPLPPSTPHYHHDESCKVPLSWLEKNSRFHKVYAKPDGVVLLVGKLYAIEACSVVGVPILKRGDPTKRGW